MGMHAAIAAVKLGVQIIATIVAEFGTCSYFIGFHGSLLGSRK